ncbi:MAG: hypothetical protein E7Z92_05895 [Cyanobacteria bacterium SIG31]|nr:hypothetical protein [Cyanobacteria bacterium SIG31]
MTLVNIISAIGNNSTIYPLLVRDCGIENPIKIGLTYKQNLKDSRQMANNALRERTIDEYVCSAIWLGGIPVMDKICNWGIKALGYDPNVDMNLFKENSKQGLNLNYEKFKNIASKEAESLKKVIENPKTYTRLQACKFVLSTAIPVFLMGYCLPKMNFALTDKLSKKDSNTTPASKEKQTDKAKNIAFKGSFVTSLANMSTVNKMAVTDGGLTIGRVSTGRNTNERLELGFKMLGMMFLNFVAPKWIAKGFDKTSNVLFNTNVDLDPKILNDEKNFIKAVKNNTLELPQNGKIIEFLDKNPNSQFTKMVQNFCGVKFLENGIRDPRYFVDEKKIANFQKEIENFVQKAKESGNVEKFGRKALWVKSGNILANVVISSVLLAICLPKLTFYLRKLITGSDAEPGLVKK